tara:strand:+ start:1166 stop:1816 length:651 start_codon:yes stop_codon:yes gene_type:complete
MTNALNQITEQFERSHDVNVTVVYGGSSSLARQLANGAPADLFVSANSKWMNYLVKKGIINSDNVTNLMSNELVVVAPKGANGSLDINDVEAWLTKLEDGRLSIGQTNAVPAGIYAKQALVNLGVWDQISSRLAPTNNVRIALALVERGETPLGIVYHTDAISSDTVTKMATLPSTSHDSIVYPVAYFNERETTQAFMSYLTSKEALATFHSFGFK